MAGEPAIRDNNGVPTFIAVDPSITEAQNPDDRGNSIKRGHILKDPVTIDGQAYNAFVVYDASPDSGTGTEFDDGDAIDTDSQGTLILGATAVPGVARVIHVDASGDLQVDVLTMPTVTISPTFDDGDTIDTDSQGFLIMGATKALPGVARAITVDASGDLQVDVLTLPITQLDDGDSVTTDTQGNLMIGVEDGALPQNARAIRTNASGHIIVTATNLDIRDLVAATDSVSAVCTGNIAHDTGISGNPVRVGGRANSSPLAPVAVDDVTDAWNDLTGRRMVLRGHPLVVSATFTGFDPSGGATQTIVAQAGVGSGNSIHLLSMVLGNEAGAGVIKLNSINSLGTQVNFFNGVLGATGANSINYQWQSWRKVGSNLGLTAQGAAVAGGLTAPSFSGYFEYFIDEN